LFKTVSILYIICFGSYVLFCRQPDFFDGEKSPAVIHWQTDSSSGTKIPQALYSDGKKQYAIDARYFLRDLKEGEKWEVIYESATPEKAAVYAFWGYWITWGELIISVVFYLALFQIAVSVTKNPTAESLVEQLGYVEEKKRKYQE